MEKKRKIYSRTVQIKFTMKRVISHESLRSPKTFTEEVADALGMRARTLGNSHPSVMLGREKRLMESLIYVGRALRTAHKNTEEKSLDPSCSPCGSVSSTEKPKINKENTRVENRKNQKPDLVAGDSKEQGAIMKNRIKPRRPRGKSRTPLKDRDMQRNFSKNSRTVVEKEYNECHGSRRELNSIHIRLTQDTYGEYHTSTPGCFGTKEKGCFRGSRKTLKTPQQVEPIRQRHHSIPNSVTTKRKITTSFLRKEDREAIRNIFEAHQNRQLATKNKKSLRNRIREIANRSYLKAARKRVRGAVNTGVKRVEDTIERVKNCFVRQFRN